MNHASHSTLTKHLETCTSCGSPRWLKRLFACRARRMAARSWGVSCLPITQYCKCEQFRWHEKRVNCRVKEVQTRAYEHVAGGLRSSVPPGSGCKAGPNWHGKLCYRILVPDNPIDSHVYIQARQAYIHTYIHTYTNAYVHAYREEMAEELYRSTAYA